jgi:hypothetical protein
LLFGLFEKVFGEDRCFRSVASVYVSARHVVVRSIVLRTLGPAVIPARAPFL